MKIDVVFLENNNELDANLEESSQSFGAGFKGLITLNGKDGASAYEIAVNNGFEGTEEEWLESLKGEDGKDGKDGATGAPGKDGAPGAAGKDGKDGYTPVKGTDYFTEADRQEMVKEVKSDLNAELDKKLDNTGGTMKGDLTFEGGKIKGLEDAEADDEAVPYGQMQARFKTVPTLANGSSIPSRSDLDTYTTIGNYSCYGNALTLVNKPADLKSSSCLLRVFSSHGNIMYKGQELFESGTGVYFYRYKLLTADWTQWRKSYNSLNKPTPEEIGALPNTGGTMKGDITFEGGKLKGVTTAEADDEAVPFGQMKQYVAENGGGGGVRDYNELTNRPFYSETGIVDILPETTVEIDPKSSDSYLPDVLDVHIGNTYTVKWNSTEYTCVAQAFDMDGVPAIALGDLGALTGGDSTGEPFVMLCLSAVVAAELGTGCAVMALDGSESVTLSISCEGEVVHKLEGKYLPEGTPYVELFDDVIIAEWPASLDSDGTFTEPVGQLVEGYVYKVNWGGTIYECVARKVTYYVGDVQISAFLLGNGSDNVIGDGVETGDPFILAISSIGYKMLRFNTAPENNEFSVTGYLKTQRINEYCLAGIAATKTELEAETAKLATKTELEAETAKLATKTELEAVKTSVGEGKALIASAVTDKGVETADDATFAEMAENIAAIESGGGVSIEGIPVGYAKVDYIKFTGDQTVDTGIICNQNTELRIVYTRDSSASMYMYGVVNDGNTASVTAYLTSAGGSWRFGNKYSAKAILTNENVVQTAVVNKAGFLRADDTATISGVADFETPHSLTLGSCRNANGTYGSPQFIGKVFLFELYQAGTLALQLVPVANAEGVYRFWDKISETFFDSITDTALDGGASVPIGSNDAYEATLASIIDGTVTALVLPDDLKSIREYAFYKCANLALTTLPSDVTSIGNSAFAHCLNLALTSIPSGVTSIEPYAFDCCYKLALTELPSGVTSIGSYAFRNCVSLKSMSIPSGVTSIGNGAFRGCHALTEVTFVGTPTSVSSIAFELCPALLTINVPWAEGAVANAPWGATNATINYNYTGE